MEELLIQFASLGAVGLIAYALFKNTMDEKILVNYKIYDIIQIYQAF